MFRESIMGSFSGGLPNSAEAQPRWRTSVSHNWERPGPNPQIGSDADKYENTDYASEGDARSAFEAIKQQHLVSRIRPGTNDQLSSIDVELLKTGAKDDWVVVDRARIKAHRYP